MLISFYWLNNFFTLQFNHILKMMPLAAHTIMCRYVYKSAIYGLQLLPFSSKGRHEKVLKLYLKYNESKYYVSMSFLSVHVECQSPHLCCTRDCRPSSVRNLKDKQQEFIEESIDRIWYYKNNFLASRHATNRMQP